MTHPELEWEGTTQLQIKVHGHVQAINWDH